MNNGNHGTRAGRASTTDPEPMPSDGRLLRTGTALTVAALAIVAAASSFGHMRELATRHGQEGWQSLAFPLSVDGLELVATLVLFAEHRAKGRATSVLPWAALALGTAASIGANIAVGPPDLLGRCVSGWPGLALIASLKLLTMTLTAAPANPGAGPAPAVLAPADHARAASPPPPRPAPEPARAAIAGTSPGREPATAAAAVPLGAPPRRPATESLDQPPDRAGSSGEAADEQPGRGTLLSQSRAIRDRLAATGQSLTRRELVAQLRAGGHTVSNKSAGNLLRELRDEAATDQPNLERTAAPPASSPLQLVASLHR